MLNNILAGQFGQNPDPYFEYVTLLLHGDGTNGGQNNTFVDTASSGRTFTRGGNTTQGSYSPYGNLWSNYFDGSGDYLTVPNSTALNLAGGSYTIEAFIFAPNNYADYRCIIAKRVSSSTSTAWELFLNITDGRLGFYNGTIYLSSSTPTANSWNHVAAVFDGTNINLYLNGSRVLQTAITNADVSTNVLIGYAGTGTEYFNGYISNIRVVKGSALYSGTSITVPTAPLTAVSGTSLLTCQSNRFLDNSSTNASITRTGDVSVQRFSPFSPTTAYSTSTISGSGYFDGTGDYLTTPLVTDLDIREVNATVEGWVYFNSTATDQILIQNWKTGGGGGPSSWTVYLEGGVLKVYSVRPGVNTYDAGPGLTGGGTAVTAGRWYHFALVGTPTTTTFYVNGTSVATAAYAIGGANATILDIGANTTFTTSPVGFLNGYLANLRIVKGAVVYSGNFTPPTTPLTAISNTTFLMNFTNASIFDNAMMADLETVGNAQIDTTIKKYGTGSLEFDGTSDYLLAPANLAFSFGTGDFTIEAWVYIESSTQTSGANDAAIIELRSTGATANGFIFNIRPSASGFKLNFYTDGAANLAATTLSYATWHHVAVTRSGSSVRLFANGNVDLTITKSNNFSNTPNPTIGASLLYSSSSITGYIDDFRITKGIARYTTNFTPPGSAFPNT